MIKKQGKSERKMKLTFSDLVLTTVSPKHKVYDKKSKRAAC